MELRITLDEFKLIKQFYPEFTRKQEPTNDFIIGWSELMPVVEKIHIAFSIHSTQCKSIEMALFRLDKQGLYMAVVEFIKWYNEQPK